MIEANRQHKDLIIDILVSAFKDNTEDTSINFVVKQDAKRVERMKVLMGYLFEKALLFGKVFLSENKKACLLVIFSERERITVKTIALNIELALKCIGLKNIFKVLKRQRLLKRFHPGEDHIRPIIMGVSKDYFGRGSAAKLVLQVLHPYNEKRLPIIIDTVSDDNVKLYRKFGFKIKHRDESLGYPIYFMRLN